MNDDEIFDLPDLQFAKWCEKTFAINRGVYNTIDEKLFELGYKHFARTAFHEIRTRDEAV